MIKFYIAKFEKALLIQTKKHDYSELLWKDSNEHRCLVTYIDGKKIYIYYNGHVASADEYVSLCLDYSKYENDEVNNGPKSVYCKKFISNEERDKALDIFIKAVEYFKQHSIEYIYI